jgi:stage II sporulation protein AA (anti-sigma F factor antagonist)
MSPESDPGTLPPDAEPFRCDISHEREAVRLRALGALDLVTVPILEAQVAQLRDAGFRRLVLDLSDLGFMDSSGLRCIIKLDAEARQDGFSMALVPGPRAVQRVFELTGTTAQLPFIDA